MKKRLVLLLVVISVITMSFAVTVSAEYGDWRDDYMKFFLSDTDGGRHYILTSIGCAVDEVVIPDEYNGKPVCELGHYKWMTKHPFDVFEYEKINKIYLSENIYSIFQYPDNGKLYTEYENGLYLGTKDNPYYALMGLADPWTATEFTLHPNAEIIAGYAFRGATGLKKLTLSDSLKYIRYDALDCHNDIEGFTFDLNYSEYGNCRYLGTPENPYHALVDVVDAEAETVQVHEDTKVIMPYAFSYNGDNINVKGLGKIESITIPKSVISVGLGAFQGCNNLKEINFEAESIEALEICEIGVEMPENVTVNWGYGKEAEDVPEESAPSTSDEGDGSGNTIIWVICGVAALAVVVGVLTAVLARKRKTV